MRADSVTERERKRRAALLPARVLAGAFAPRAELTAAGRG